MEKEGGEGEKGEKGEGRWPEGTRHARALPTAQPSLSCLCNSSGLSVPLHMLHPPPRRRFHSPLSEQPQLTSQGPAGYSPLCDATEVGSFLYFLHCVCHNDMWAL